MGEIDFSLVTNLWSQQQQTWNLIITKLKEKKAGKKMIFQEAKKEYVPHPLEASLEESERG